ERPQDLVRQAVEVTVRNERAHLYRTGRTSDGGQRNSKLDAARRTGGISGRAAGDSADIGIVNGCPNIVRVGASRKRAVTSCAGVRTEKCLTAARGDWKCKEIGIQLEAGTVEIHVDCEIGREARIERDAISAVVQAAAVEAKVGDGVTAVIIASQR